MIDPTDFFAMVAKFPAVWVTRDLCYNGVLSGFCDVWFGKPKRDDFGVWWLPSEDGFFLVLSIAEVREWIRVVPETDRECIRVDNPRMVVS